MGATPDMPKTQAGRDARGRGREGELFMGHIGSRRFGKRIAAAALVVGVASATVGCSSGSGHKSAAIRALSGPSSAATPGDPAGGSADTTAPPTSGLGQPTTEAAPASAAPAHAGATRGAVQSGGGATTVTTRPATTGTRPTTPVSTGPAPVAPGTYQYNLVGAGSSVVTIGKNTTTTPAAVHSPLTVSTTGAGLQQWANSSTTTSLLFNNSGVFLLAETVPLFGTTCTFNSPVASPPWPLAAGKMFSGQATCGQGQATSALTLKGSVSGSAVNSFVVYTTLTLSGTTLVISEWDTYLPSLGLPVQSKVQVNGGLPGYSIDSLATYALASARPS